MMKKILSLFMILILAGCAGGGSGGGSTNGNANQGETPVIPGQDDPNIGEELTAAEQLFGQGNGTGATPTELLPRTDNLGFEYLSFGAWGNVYDIKHNDDPTPNIAYFEGQQGGHYSFITNAENENMNSWNHTANASVADSVFAGPAIMHNVTKYDTKIDIVNPCPTCGYTIYFKHDPDYGTMQLAFGHDITNYVLTFTMNNPENNLVLTYPNDASNGYINLKFDDTNERAHVFYRDEIPGVGCEDPYCYIQHYKEYEGYGIKQ